MKKYVLCPGLMAVDGERKRYVDPMKIAELYGVCFTECVVWERNLTCFKTRGANPDDLLWLYPDPTGEYKLPDAPGPRKQASKVDLGQRI